MSLLSRIANVFRRDGFQRRLNDELDEEFASHIEEALADGRDPKEARQAFGPWVRSREETRNMRLIPWLDSLRADVIFGWRQLRKRKVTSAAAILSLALAIGACTSAFRLIDALLLRPLPISDPHNLYVLARKGIGPDGEMRVTESSEYPLFQDLRAAAKEKADLLAISYSVRRDVTYGSDPEMEKAYVQYVSGTMFDSFGLKPVLGRLLTAADDVVPKAHPYAVISYDYWTRRFGSDRQVIGRIFRAGQDSFQIIGVAPAPFSGAETGTMVDIFVPTMMHAGVAHADWSWFRVFIRPKPGVNVDSVLDRLRGPFQAVQLEIAKGLKGVPQRQVDQFLQQTLLVESASAGISEMQEEYRGALIVLGLLVALVLLIACANVANLMAAQAASREREMALRVSIGAGRLRLVQLVLVEGLILSFLAAAAGGCFAWWSAPFVLNHINPPDNPMRLLLPADLRVLGFAVALALTVTLLFGLAPALRVSGIKPAGALRGGEDPRAQGRSMNLLVAFQAAFCFVVLFIAGLFLTTFQRITHQPTGFSADRILTMDIATSRPQLPVFWDQVTQHLREQPGVEQVALAGWPLLSRNGMRGYIGIGGVPAGNSLAYFLRVSPGWQGLMKIPLIDGRDFRPEDRSPGVAIVNQTFAKVYFGGENPIGKWFEKRNEDPGRSRMQIIGIAGDAAYRDLREPITPTVYVPIDSADLAGAPEPRNSATILVRSIGANPLALASLLRQEVPKARPEFRVSNILTQEEINQSTTIRERILAMLALFFAIVALLLAGIGLYGVLDYSVLRRRREIGIRMAIGAQSGRIIRLVTTNIFVMLAAGAATGLALGLASARYMESLLYQVRATDLRSLVFPAAALLGTAFLAAIPPIIRAVRIDPASMLHLE